MAVAENKDWNGNKISSYAILGASSHSKGERASNDYYCTPPKATRALLDVEKFNHNVWECSVGGGDMAEVLKEYGYDVRCSDIVDRGYIDTEELDFLVTKDNDRDIITNSPYSMAKDFVKHALDISNKGTKVAMLLKIQFLESKSRRPLFEEYPPKVVYVFSERVMCGKNGIFGTESSAVCYCWFVWEKGFEGEPIIRWL